MVEKRRPFLSAVVLALSCGSVIAAPVSAEGPGSRIETAEETLRAPLPGHPSARRDLDVKLPLPALPSAPPDGLETPLAVAATQTLLAEGFEGVFPAGSWTVFDNNGSANGEVYWDDTNFRSYAGSWSAGCADGGANASPPGGNYSNGMDSWMVYGPVNLSDATAATLSFRYWLSSEPDFDYFKFVVSTDGSNFYGFQTSGSTGGWVSGSLDLTNVPTLGNVTGQPNVWIAFIFSSDSSISAEGVYVDEVLLQKTVGPTAPEIRIEPLTVAFNQQAQLPIYVEIDWMEDGTHSHKPSQAVIDRIVQSFAAAGYTIHIDVSNAVPHQGTLDITGSVAGSPSVQSIMSQSFDHAADSRYYYSLWGHNYSINGSFTTSSGIADLPGRVHLVTLGSFSGQTGTFSNQVGTFVHEFGHNLGQLHGGADSGNYKPNYLSVMNYFYQLAGLGPSLFALGFANSASGFDDFSYSHGLLPSLNESNLDESFGIGLGRAVDWNCNGVLQSSVAKDIQGGDVCAASGGQSVITDFDNWTSLSSQIRTLGGSDRPAGRTVTCITPEEFRPIQARIDRLRAAGLLPPDGPGLPLAQGNAGHSFLIFNDGSSPLTVSGMSLDTATPWIHWAPQAPFTVPAGKSQEVLVFADLDQAPPGQTARRLLVQSNDSDENPYPGGVNLVVSGIGGSQCYALTRGHTGSGADPVATPGASSGCSAGQYHAGEVISLAASPSAGWRVAGWSGTSNDGSTLATNALTMPAAGAAVSVAYAVDAALSFYTVTPCRILDTRSGSPLASGVKRTLAIANACGIPSTAKAVSLNVTALGATGSGHMALWPADLGQPATSVMNFGAGATRANNAILPLAIDGSGALGAQASVVGSGTVHLLLDVNGYFQ